MRFTVRDLVYIGLFGAMWGTIEITSGSILHVFNVPFSGVNLSPASFNGFVASPTANVLVSVVKPFRPCPPE